MDVYIRELYGRDFDNDFLETLAHLAEINLSVEEAKAIFRTRLGMGIRTYVALDQEKVVGTISLLVEQKFIHGGGHVGHIEDVAVHPAYVGQGIGSALVRHVIEQARKWGCYKLILSCFEDRVAFYERLGFRRYEVGMRLDLPPKTQLSEPE